MAAPGNGSPQGKKDRREAAREKARLEREAAKRRERRNRVFLQGGIAVVVIAAVVIGFLVYNNVQANKPSGIGPKNMASNGILFTGESGAIVPTKTAASPKDATPKPTKTSSTSGVANIVTYVDWACPVCKDFEASYSTDIADMVTAGTATLEVHPIAILDANYPGSRYSSRAANVAACMANYDPDDFLTAQTAFYDNQPAEGSSGLTNTKMIALLKSAGITNSDVTSCIKTEKFQSWVTKVTSVTTSDSKLVNSSGGFGTPTVFVNGERWNNSDDFLTFVSSSTK